MAKREDEESQKLRQRLGWLDGIHTRPIPVEFLLIMHALPSRLYEPRQRREAKKRLKRRRYTFFQSSRLRSFLFISFSFTLAESSSALSVPSHSVRLSRTYARVSCERFTYKFNKHISYLMHALSRECFDRGDRDYLVALRHFTFRFFLSCLISFPIRGVSGLLDGLRLHKTFVLFLIRNENLLLFNLLVLFIIWTGGMISVNWFSYDTWRKWCESISRRRQDVGGYEKWIPLRFWYSHGASKNQFDVRTYVSMYDMSTKVQTSQQKEASSYLQLRIYTKSFTWYQERERERERAWRLNSPLIDLTRCRHRRQVAQVYLLEQIRCYHFTCHVIAMWHLKKFGYLSSSSWVSGYRKHRL